MDNIKKLSDNEIIMLGIDTLNKVLGPATALRFLSILHRNNTDYVEISRKLYRGQSLEEIFERAGTNWTGQPEEKPE